jgi:hypothetical protein
MSRQITSKQVAQESIAHFGNAFEALVDTIELLWQEQERNKKLKPPISPRGTYVSRSTYQKVVEENKKLKQNIRTLLDDGHPDFLEVWVRWTDHFEKDTQFNQDLREILSHVSPQSPKTS